MTFFLKSFVEELRRSIDKRELMLMKYFLTLIATVKCSTDHIFFELEDRSEDFFHFPVSMGNKNLIVSVKHKKADLWSIQLSFVCI